MSFEILWNDAIDFLSIVPAVVWGALMASCITLGGVVASNRQTLSRLHIQLDADAQRKKEERTSALRKDVLLSLTDEMMRFGSILINLTTVDMAGYNASNSLKDVTSAFAKAHVVAEPNTVLLINKMSHSYAALYSTVVGKIGPLQRARIDVKHGEIRYDEIKKDVEAVARQLVDIIPGTKQTDEQKYLRKRYDAGISQLNEKGAALNVRNQDCATETIAVNKFILSELARLSDIQRELLIHIRQDLGFTKDLPGFKEQVESQQKQTDAAVLKLFDAIPQDYFSPPSGSKPTQLESQPRA